ncbi:MAG: LexA family protein [Streptosporangiaceae bacterium]
MLRLSGQNDAGPGTAVPGDGRIAEVPLVGRIAAGIPVIADQLAELAEDIISVPRMLTGEGSLIALRVSGDSMIGAAIGLPDELEHVRPADADALGGFLARGPRRPASGTDRRRYRGRRAGCAAGWPR